jgi:hypothetical protein
VVITLTTLLPTLTTTAVTAITGPSATSGGTITNAGVTPITASGVCWGTAANPTTADGATTENAASGSFTSTFTGLTVGTTYYVRAYATNSAGTAYGQQISFTSQYPTYTFAYTGAKTTFTIPAWASSITLTAKGAQGGSNRNYGTTGGYGAVLTGTFAVTPGAVLNLLVGGAGTDAKGAPSGGGGTFIATATNTALLVAGGGGGAGSSYNATLINASLTTSGNAGYGGTSGAGGTGGGGGSAGRLTGGGGGFSSNGGASSSDGGTSVSGPGLSFLNGGAGGASATTIAQCGGMYWTSAPGGFGGGGGAGYAAAGAGGGYSGGGGTDGCAPGSGGGGGSYNGGTSPSSSATNTGHGQILITIPVSLPTLTTSAISGVTATGATSGGTISASGLNPITASGVCWSTSPTPTIAHSKTAENATSGAFTSTLTGLTAGTTYYLRAYATNAAGTAYGAQVSFTPGLQNWLRGAPTSDPTNRRAFVTSMAGINGATNYAAVLETWTGSWQAPQAIYEHGGNLDDATTWYQTSASEGSTWSNPTPGTSAGELVVDMQTTRTLARFVVFQMFSDGKTTHAYFYSHASTGATPPANTDAGWVLRGGGAIGVGATSGSVVTSPTTFTMTPFTSRYIKLRAQNDGTQASPSYIELKGVKAFSQ